MLSKMNSTILLVILMFIADINCHNNHHQDQQVFQGNQQHQQPPVQHHQDQQQNQQQHHQNTQMNLNMNKEHVLEHLDGVINKPKEEMTQDEQNFYYFKLHDYDNNNMLDGLELVNAFAHSDEHDDHGKPPVDPNNPTPPHVPQRMSDQELIKVIDEIMEDEDKNLDGFITYQEFLVAIKGQ